VTTVAIGVIDFSSGGLLGIKAEFGVSLPPLDVAGTKRDERCERRESHQNLLGMESSCMHCALRLHVTPERTISLMLRRFTIIEQSGCDSE